jgi:uncharacterized protein
MLKKLTIDLRTFPEDGKQLTGELDAACMELPTDGGVKALSPLRYDIQVFRDGAAMMLTGSLSAEFELQCGRCAEWMPYRVELDAYGSDAEMSSSDERTIDLTDTLREDILVALPSYPRCEDGNVESRECPAQGQFDEIAPIEELAPDDAPQDGTVWAALDNIKH